MLRNATLALLFVFAGCGSDEPEEEAFDTLEDCFVDHHEGEEGLPTVEALIVCCLEHPIAGEAPSCGDTVADCEAHVGGEIDEADASDAEVTEACEGYVDEL